MMATPKYAVNAITRLEHDIGDVVLNTLPRRGNYAMAGEVVVGARYLRDLIRYAKKMATSASAPK